MAVASTATQGLPAGQVLVAHGRAQVEQFLERNGFAALCRGSELAGPHHDFPDGCVTQHVKDLRKKAEIGGGRGGLDQSLLLEAFEAELRLGQELGWFVADLLLSLGLLGTVIGFILMLGPISGLDSADENAIKGALAAMSGGMAVALYTTLAGLVGGMLLKVQGFLLDGAVQELVGRTIRLTEVSVLPAIERGRRDAAA